MACKTPVIKRFPRANVFLVFRNVGATFPSEMSAPRYTILRKIADGGTAEIFLAKQTGAQGFEKMVVLKRIFNTFYSDPQFRHMLVDEAHIAMSLSHSNI